MRNMTIVQHTYKTCRADVEKFEGVLLKDIIYYLWYCFYDSKMNVEQTSNYFRAVVNTDFKIFVTVRNTEELILVSTETGKNRLVYPLVDIPLLKNQICGRGYHVHTH